MAGCSDYLANALMKHVVSETTFVPAATLYLALYNGSLTAAGVGTENSGGSYARQPVTWAAVAGGTVANSAVVTFSALMAGNRTYAGLWDAVTGGNLYFYGVLNAPVSVVAGADLTADISEIIASLL